MKKLRDGVDYRSLSTSERPIFMSAVKMLDERGVFNFCDTPVLASYARNVVLARTASKDIYKLGIVVEFQDRGCTKYKENPAIGVMQKAQTAAENTALKLGITPLGRQRIKEGKNKKTKGEELMDSIMQ